MTEQQTYPTPLADAARALREEHDAKRAEFKAERIAALSRSMTKEAAVDLAVEKYIDAPRSSVSKAMAIEEIADGDWEDTPLAKQMRKANDEAHRESKVISRVENRDQSVEFRQKQMMEVMAKPTLRYNSRGIVEAALDLQTAFLASLWWEKVGNWMTPEGEAEPLSPLDAVARVREEATTFALNPHHNRLLSRSTSLVANMTEDLQRIAATDFLEETDRIVRGW
ncbi:hypothetical protein [Terracoccus sp. 273MFTsu3.1]|uniref:hypothetical protein n=1 Tax=Terracoccus sp. 273MFTsu3.1 TaxID=1172188 RepID=UPI000399D1DF|nr:hypothetical protein [Terracoccus sp. 273MFTsu3.1]